MRAIKLILILNALILSTFSYAAQNYWQIRTENDLNAIRQALLQNSPEVAMKDKEFLLWLDSGFQKTKIFLNQVNSKEKWFYTLSYYVVGFKEPHLFLDRSMQSEFPLKFSGIVLGYQNNYYKVTYRDRHFKNLPPLGAVLLSCDTRTGDQILTQDVLPFYFLPPIKSTRYTYAPLLSMNFNPFRKLYSLCLFYYDNGIHTHSLTWKMLSEKQKKQLFSKLKITSHELGIKRLGKKGLWVSLPTFDFDHPVRKQINSLELKKYKLLVFDLSQNSGGPDLFWQELMKNVLNINSAEREVIAKNGCEVTYLTKPNLKNFENFQVSYLNSLEDGLKRGDKFYHWPCSQNKYDKQKIIAKIQKRYKNKIYFITDQYCTSACTRFVDFLSELPFATQVGVETSADTVYGDNSSIEISPQLTLYYPTSVQLNRKRLNFQSYTPKANLYEFVELLKADLGIKS